MIKIKYVFKELNLRGVILGRMYWKIVAYGDPVIQGKKLRKFLGL